MVLYVFHKFIIQEPFRVEQDVLNDHLPLLQKKLSHDGEKVATRDWQELRLLALYLIQLSVCLISVKEELVITRHFLSCTRC